jgi:predicted Ser/Thr protein kinase
MHGLIFSLLQRFARETGGMSLWKQLLQEANLGGKSYSPMSVYPDEDTIAIVEAAARFMHKPPGTVLEEFGQFIAPELIRLYGRLIKPEWKTFDVIENTEELIHSAVRVGNPGAKPPVLHCTWTGADDLYILYSSERKLCHLAKGIVKGLAQLYGEDIIVTEDACMLKGAPLCALHLRHGVADQPADQDQKETSDESTFISARDPTRQHSPIQGVSFLTKPRQGDELGRLGDYRVLQWLGQGAMGIVFRAEDTRLGRQVALKVMQPLNAANPEMRQWFLREARAMAAVKNEHIVTIYEVGDADGLPFLAMEFLEGEPLDLYQQHRGLLPLAEVVRISREVARGLAAAHQRGLIHRDIKPANIWLEAPEGRVKILDFGLARITGDTSELSHPGMIVGTPSFMAPEQARGDPIDARADLFSLGCVLYWLCTNQQPFPRSDPRDMFALLQTYEPPAPQDLSPRISPMLSDWTMRLLEKDPDHRPQSAQVVVEVLREVERQLPVVETGQEEKVS